MSAKGKISSSQSQIYIYRKTYLLPLQIIWDEILGLNLRYQTFTRINQRSRNLMEVGVQTRRQRVGNLFMLFFFQKSSVHIWWREIGRKLPARQGLTEINNSTYSRHVAFWLTPELIYGRTRLFERIVHSHPCHSILNWPKKVLSLSDPLILQQKNCIPGKL